MIETQKWEKFQRARDLLDGKLGAILLISISVIISLCILFPLVSFISNLEYPEAEYVMLENEFSNIITEKKDIDFNRLSSKDILFTEKFILKNDSEMLEISLSRDTNAFAIDTLMVTGKANEDLSEIKLNRNYTQEYYNTIKIVLIVGTCAMALAFVCLICLTVLCLTITALEKRINKYQISVS